MRGITIAVTLWFMAIATAWAQEQTGVLQGRAVDCSGAALPGTTVTVAGPTILGGSRSTSTSEAGRLPAPSDSHRPLQGHLRADRLPDEGLRRHQGTGGRDLLARRAARGGGRARDRYRIGGIADHRLGGHQRQLHVHQRADEHDPERPRRVGHGEPGAGHDHGRAERWRQQHRQPDAVPRAWQRPAAKHVHPGRCQRDRQQRHGRLPVLLRHRQLRRDADRDELSRRPTCRPPASC